MIIILDTRNGFGLASRHRGLQCSWTRGTISDNKQTDANSSIERIFTFAPITSAAALLAGRIVPCAASSALAACQVSIFDFGECKCAIGMNVNDSRLLCITIGRRRPMGFRFPFFVSIWLAAKTLCADGDSHLFLSFSVHSRAYSKQPTLFIRLAHTHSTHPRGECAHRRYHDAG